MPRRRSVEARKILPDPKFGLQNYLQNLLM